MSLDRRRCGYRESWILIRVSPYRRSRRSGSSSSSGARRSLSVTTRPPDASNGSRACDSRLRPRSPGGMGDLRRRDRIGGRSDVHWRGTRARRGTALRRPSPSARRLARIASIAARELVDQGRCCGAARERLDRHRARPGEQIEHALAGDRGRASRRPPRARGRRSAGCARPAGRAASRRGARRRSPASAPRNGAPASSP